MSMKSDSLVQGEGAKVSVYKEFSARHSRGTTPLQEERQFSERVEAY